MARARGVSGGVEGAGARREAPPFEVREEGGGEETRARLLAAHSTMPAPMAARAGPHAGGLIRPLELSDAAAQREYAADAAAGMRRQQMAITAAAAAFAAARPAEAVMSAGAASCDPGAHHVGMPQATLPPSRPTDAGVSLGAIDEASTELLPIAAPAARARVPHAYHQRMCFAYFGVTGQLEHCDGMVRGALRLPNGQHSTASGEGVLCRCDPHLGQAIAAIAALAVLCRNQLSAPWQLLMARNRPVTAAGP